MSFIQQKNEYFEDMSRVFKLLGSPVKLRLLNYISFCPRTVEDCAKKFNQSVQNISLHLIALAKADILEVEQIKNFRYYSISSHPVVQIVSKALLADPRTLLSDDKLWDKSQTELVKAVKNKRVVLVDLRDFDEASYIPLKGAMRFEGELSHLIDFLKTFPKKERFVILCKGRMCERLAESVDIASQADFNVTGLPLSAMELKQLSHLFN